MEDTIIKWHEDVVDSIWQKAVNGLSNAADNAVERAKSNCPVKTGALQESIQKMDSYTESDCAYVYIGSDLDYAGYIELGTAHQASQPYLRPAIDADMIAKDICES